MSFIVMNPYFDKIIVIIYSILIFKPRLNNTSFLVYFSG